MQLYASLQQLTLVTHTYAKIAEVSYSCYAITKLFLALIFYVCMYGVLNIQGDTKVI